MFEKEAEEYKDNTRIKDENTYIGFPNERISELQDFEGNYIDISERIIKAFKDGAEFGYNKANEWHSLRKKPDDLPTDESDVLCYLGREDSEVGYFHQEKKQFFTIDGKEINPVAWKEIYYPQESER